MIYRVLSVPCVYVSFDYGNVRAPHRADDFGAHARTHAVHSPGTGLVPPAPLHTSGPVVGVWRGRDKTYFDNASLIDSVSFQVSCRFPDLVYEVNVTPLCNGRFTSIETGLVKDYIKTTWVSSVLLPSGSEENAVLLSGSILEGILCPRHFR